MLNNINNYSALLNASTNTASTTNKSEIDNIIEQHKESSADKIADTTLNQGNLYLSTKAQKISALSNEFFSGETLNFNDVESLKERAYQLGLISQNEYAKLTNSATQAESDSSEVKEPTMSLTDFIGNLLDRLQTSEDDENESSDNDPEQESEALNALIQALEGAKEIIANVEEAKQETDFNDKLQSTLGLLKETIAAPTFDKIPLDDKVGLSKVYQTLEIVDQLAPQRLNNEKLNKYLNNLFS